MSVLALGFVSVAHGVFSNRDIPSTYIGQLRAIGYVEPSHSNELCIFGVSRKALVLGKLVVNIQKN